MSPNANATGMWNSINLLQDHQYAAISSPEFWFELELKNLAKTLGVTEKHIPTLEGEEEPAAEEPAEDAEKKPDAEPKKPAEAPATEELALYQEGADAYNKDDFPTAEAAWKKLLSLPEAKRKERSVWAEYMLGRMAIKAKTPEGAPEHFANARKLAKAGFSDEQGLAAASYGWEAHMHMEKDPAKAIELYLRDLATGNARAYISLKWCVRDAFFPVEGAVDDPDFPKPKIGAIPMETAAQSPLLRQVLTRWFLAMEMDINSQYAASYEGDAVKPQSVWLKLLEKHAPAAEEADRLAWLAYRSGEYDQAQRWLKLVPKETGMSGWLTAKLALRNGDAKKAAAAMDKAQAAITQEGTLEVTSTESHIPMQKFVALADQATIQLSQDKFADALTNFLKAGYWVDAAYVAERVLTLAELQEYVNQNYPKPAKREETHLEDELNRVITLPEAPDQEPLGKNESEHYDILKSEISDGVIAFDSPRAQDAIAWRLRWLLARRMVREDQEAAARPYFPRVMQPVLDQYLAAISTAKEKKTAKADAAKAWWKAAWIARYAGMELMGTEGIPDDNWEEGIYSTANVVIARRTGLHPDDVDYIEEKDEATKPPKLTKKVKFSIPPSAEEKRRLAKHILAYEYRYHYRWVAAALAKKAAALLPDGSEEKADVLNNAGTWMFSRDEKREEEFFFEIKRACPNTVIGKEVLKTKHTLPLSGPWSGKLPEEG